jgi:hypothetical protein
MRFYAPSKSQLPWKITTGITSYRGGNILLPSLLLLLSIIWAWTAPNHPPAVKKFFEAQFWANLTIELCQHLLGWDSLSYAIIYDAFTAFMLVASTGVVWSYWDNGQLPSKRPLHSHWQS